MTEQEKEKWWAFFDKYLNLEDCFVGLRIQEEFGRLVIPTKKPAMVKLY